MKLALSMILMLLGGPLSVLCQNAQPIPTEWLHAGRLVVPKFLFSINSPNPEVQWSYQEYPSASGSGTTTFTVSFPNKDKYKLNVQNIMGPMNAADARQFLQGSLNGLRKTLPPDWQVKDTYIEQSRVLPRDSYKLTVTLLVPDNSPAYLHGYVSSGKLTYSFWCYSPNATEPTQFTTFVTSFALLSSNTVNEPANLFDIVLLCALILAVWGAIVDWRYRRRGGVKPTRNQDIKGLAIVGVGIATIFFLGVHHTSSAYSFGEYVGTMGIPFMIIILSVWEFARWLIRRKNPNPK